jgi:triacylglycerol lipase
MASWRGVKALIHDAVDATTHLVGEGHASVARNVRRVTDRIEPLAAPAEAVDTVRGLATEGVLATIRGVNRAVEALSDVALDAMLDAASEAAGPLIPMRSDLIGDRRLTADAALGLVNGFIGDHLARVNPELDLGFSLRCGDRPLSEGAPANATGRVVVFVHGLATTEWSWCLNAEANLGAPDAHFGVMLARDLGFTPIYARYNTGRPVPDNGARLAAALEAALAAWPVPVDELVLVGHSMGGLVCRAACNAGARAQHAWLRPLRRVVSLGTPHQGAPLARLSDAATAVLATIDLPATRILSKILDIRSAGIRDLSHGEVGDAEDAGPLLPGVAWHFLAGSLHVDPAHPVGRVIGDLLVQEPSAAGPVVHTGTFELHHARFGGLLHHQLQSHPDVYTALRHACALG